jgi:chaperonin GroES
MKIKPLGDRVLVQPLDAEEKSKGGIIIPDTAKEKPQQGKIVAVGPGRISDAGELIKPEVKAGDKVLYSKYSGAEVMVDGTEHLMMKESDILAILEK